MLALPCITHRVTVIQLTGPSSCASSYTYEIQAFGPRQLEFTLPGQLESAAISEGAVLGVYTQGLLLAGLKSNYFTHWEGRFAFCRFSNCPITSTRGSHLLYLFLLNR